ncbi:MULTISPECIES: amino acid deaminase [unclassified Pseudomonas]|uniref:amino acid deaminase n=1 Tax=unclassified Pseudomonas TaxID=196821 RepID=UPI00119AD5F9|nr:MULTISPECIES: amino acid deaminase [unclassified Pseudomonas]TWC18502.1 D-serine deaminase-like pyridoxal phosphate-dependent protein [Pseudomonas sp. SJZ075]TWC23507.1 D-serine deaminase-like pyridoxal phosphate-dependent protein [Pseudomonas sp. SJZ074]TWC34727.1 D-serine deaminase-like pyridoxal phosphate-dependent protein [Pseudomonas sp. SJZ078]TWC40546.1 D-serine deaminase-like pyridoxal phosphate-dependent protein [Pseudomonas sp. SJZ085]TWC55527.1 D-serine deaminase-like pyridoxal p
MSSAIYDAAVEKGAATVGAHLLRDVGLPALVLHRDALEHNIRWMQQFVSNSGAELAPHGKTSMTPALFRRQLDAGAWGMTLATAVQTRAAYAHGVRRVLMANQLVGTPNMALIADLLADPMFEFHCMVDHPDNVADLGAFFAARGLKLNVMIEYGVVGGRCGCRSEAEVLALAEAIRAQPALALTGIEGYEGVIHGDHAVSGIRAFAASLVGLAMQLQDSGAFALDKPIITASGSAWYDLIAESFEARNAHGRFLSVLRPGSYVAHDHGIYKEAQCCVLERRSDLHEGLQPALEVWAHVQALPEPGFAVIALGKRDVAYDAGLPVPLKRYKPGSDVVVGDDVSACKVTAVMDQHAFMTVAPGVELRIGDIIAFGTSHPCLTFDKWRVGCLVDEGLRVVESMETCF